MLSIKVELDNQLATVTYHVNLLHYTLVLVTVLYLYYSY